MLSKDFFTFLKLLAGDQSAEIWSMFDRNTGWPTYWRDPNSFAVCRFNVPIFMISFGSFLGNTILMNLFLYLGIWRFYKILLELYPKYEKWLAYALFFIPSVIFWSSGILKDGWTLTAILFIYSNFHFIFVKKTKIWGNIIWLIFWSYIAFSIRPYIFYMAIGSALIWIGFTAIKTIESTFMRTIAFPIIVFVIWILGFAILTQVGSMAGKRYSSIDAMLETAWIIQDDLKKDYYGGNSFDIGSFEPSIPGVLKKAPSAIVAGLFRPFIWEGNGPLMLASGLENFLVFLLLIYLFFSYRFLGIFKQIYNDPFILSLFVLSLTFGFSVGLTTANFGALVRYAIPAKLSLVLVLALLFANLRNNQSSSER